LASSCNTSGRAGGTLDDVLNAREALTPVYEQVLQRSVGEVALPAPPRLLDRLRLALRVRHYSPRTEACYGEWATRYIRFHRLRHPQEMGAAEVTAFLTDLGVRQRVAASTQNQATASLHSGRGIRPPSSFSMPMTGSSLSGRG
jgi:hypothetical protein